MTFWDYLGKYGLMGNTLVSLLKFLTWNKSIAVIQENAPQYIIIIMT